MPRVALVAPLCDLHIHVHHLPQLDIGSASEYIGGIVGNTL